ncbi:MAG: rhodanese-like domain-containing protein [Desulfobacteraceae bacterium]|nr:rhodanese-like domain-containing protein [Desulfobacteraceae bacterium]
MKKLGENQDIILIDTRNKTEFEKFRIPDSINVPLFALKTKDFLKPKSLILINEGYHQAQLRKTCKELNSAGFRASFIYGGLNAWKENGGQIEGDPFAQKELDKITPLDFFAEKDGENRIVIDVSSSENKNIRSLLPGSLQIPYLKDENSFVSAIRRRIGQNQKGQIVFVCFGCGSERRSV